VYAVGYLRYRAELSNRIFCISLLLFLATTTLVICSRHLGLMWVAIEATTLSTAPLIYFNHTPRSIEATWKYLLVGSVGIALALLRVDHLCRAAGETAYTGRILIFMGLLSMVFAAVFMVGQRDFKRMLAYSSVEHMGILVLGIGVGGAAIFATLLHIVTNGL